MRLLLTLMCNSRHVSNVDLYCMFQLRMLRAVVGESMLSRVTETRVRALARNWRRSKSFSFFYSLVHSVLQACDLR